MQWSFAIQQENVECPMKGSFKSVYLIISFSTVKTQTKCIPTIKPGYWNGFKENKEEKTHSTGRVVVKHLEDI